MSHPNASDPQFQQARRAPARTGPKAYTGLPTFTVVDGVQVETVGLEERVDPAWEADNSDERNGLWVAQRRALNDALNAHRASLPLHERLLTVQTDMAAASTVRASRLRGDERNEDAEVSGQRVAEGGIRPANGDGALLDDPDVQRHLHMIRRHVEQLEQILDAHRGIASARNTALLSAEEKNRMIDSMVGMRPEEIHEQHPELGSVSYIRKYRAGLGQRGVCGHEPDKCTCEGVRRPAGLRRVVIDERAA